MPEEEAEQQETMSRIFADKAALRKRMLKTLRQLSDEDLEQQSQAVTQRVFDSPYFRNARSVGCYLSMGKGELRTNTIIREILKQDKTLFVPYIPHQPSSSTAGSDSETPAMRMLRLYGSEDLERCPLDKWGIIDPGLNRRDTVEAVAREDCLDAQAPAMDLILIPGVTFDKHCNRMGRGKAYYDRFLQAYVANKASPRLLALALTPQILVDEQVPVTESDFRLDGVVHPDGITERVGN